MSARRPARLCLAAALACAAAFPAHAEQVLLPMSPVGQVWVKHVPLFHAAALECKDDPFTVLDPFNLRLNKFTASRGFPRIKPLVIELPDLDWSPGDQRPVLIYLPLSEALPIDVVEPGAVFAAERESSQVVSVAFRGAYTAQAAATRLAEVAAWIQQEQRLVNGKPRLLLYHYRAFLPNFLRCAEIQVPVQ